MGVGHRVSLRVDAEHVEGLAALGLARQTEKRFAEARDTFSWHAKLRPLDVDAMDTPMSWSPDSRSLAMVSYHFTNHDPASPPTAAVSMAKSRYSRTGEACGWGDTARDTFC